MNFDKKIDIYTNQRTTDGMGGFKTTPKHLKSIDGFTTPMKAELALKEYGIVSTTSLKVFTKDDIPTRDENGKTITFTLKFEDGTEYKVLQLADFGKMKLMLVELVMK